jgi:DNA-binding CsgD family transcriptional regulator
LKNTPPARLLDSIREVLDGGAPMSPEVARRVIRLFRDFRPPEHADYQLTAQETELLKLLVEGHHAKTAAKEMGISTNTVFFHLKNIYAKLQVIPRRRPSPRPCASAWSERLAGRRAAARPSGSPSESPGKLPIYVVAACLPSET